MSLFERLIKREVRKYAERQIDKLEKVNVRDGVKLNLLNSGILIDLSLVARNTKNVACTKARKILTILKKG
jgi:hypothetical protein